MVIDARKPQILERQVTQLLYCLVDPDLPGLDLPQQFSYLLSPNMSPGMSSCILCISYLLYSLFIHLGALCG
jgi:hypothetical protein